MAARKKLLRWLAYAGIFILLAVLQTTPGFLPTIWGSVPVFMLPAVIAVGMQEGETAGAVCGIIGGLVWDAHCTSVFGYNALFLMLLGITAGLLVQFLFRKSVVTSLIFCVCGVVLYELCGWFFFDYMTGRQDFVFCLVHIVLPVAAYTLLFAAPLYYGAVLLGRKLSLSDQSNG